MSETTGFQTTDRIEIEIRVNGQKTFYVMYRGDPVRAQNCDSDTWFVSHGSSRILSEAASLAGLIEAGC